MIIVQLGCQLIVRCRWNGCIAFAQENLMQRSSSAIDRATLNEALLCKRVGQICVVLEHQLTSREHRGVLRDEHPPSDYLVKKKVMR